MARQSPKTSFYKHTEFLSGPDFNTNPNVPGFSVRYNQPFFKQGRFKHHFRSDFLNILLILKGEITVSLNLEKYTAKKDSLIIVSPYTIKKVEKLSKDNFVSGVNFTIDFLTAIGMPKIAVELPDYFSSQYSPHWNLKRKDAATLQLLMKQLNERISSMNEQVYGKELLYHTFYIFIYEVYDMSKKYATPISHHISRKENLVMNFQHLLQKQFRNIRNVQTYAEQLNITPKYLTETVKEITGKTAGELIDSYVMLEAKLLLDDPLLSIAQIADELNFSDQSFFGKFFKRHNGVSPKEYRLSS
ncbi:MAG: AraC family transcriptional regulator [Ignavibacteria bacterium]|nr:AraC family transcriptional regulator [Ignavibacteria bacterium]